MNEISQQDTESASDTHSVELPVEVEVISGEDYSLERAGAMTQSGFDPKTRTIFLVGDISTDNVLPFMAALRALDEQPGDIRVVITSHGGEVDAGYAIFDSIRMAKNPVDIDAFGACQSCAAMILQAGRKRRLAPNCRFMIHDGNIGIENGHLDTARLISLAEEMKIGNARYQKVIAERSGKPLEFVADLCRKETYLTAEQAVQFGFADAVISPE